MDECDLPVLSVFKDLHPRVAGFVLLTISRENRLMFGTAWAPAISPASVSPRFSSMFSVEDPDPMNHGIGGSMIVPSDSRRLATVTTVPFRTCATPVESGDPTDLDRKRSWSVELHTWRAFTRPRKAFAFSWSWFATNAAHEHSRKPYLGFRRWVGRPSRTDRLAEEHQCPSTMLGLCTAPVRSDRSHTSFSLSEVLSRGHDQAHSLAWKTREPQPDRLGLERRHSFWE